MHNGAFHVARQAFSGDLFQRRPAEWFKIWVYLVGRVNHSSSKTCARGEGFFNFSEEIKNLGPGISRDTIKKSFAYFKRNQMLSTRKSTRGMFVTILNYNHFQTLSNYSSTKVSTLEAPQKHHRSTTVVKNERMEEVCEGKPDLDMVRDYFKTLGGKNGEAEHFYDHYEANGWKVGQATMKNWPAACRNWMKMPYRKTAETGLTKTQASNVEKIKAFQERMSDETRNPVPGTITFDGSLPRG